MQPDFRVFFNRNKQYFDVFLWDVHPNTFARWDAGRWAYVDFETQEHHRKGRFADLHIVKRRFRPDSIRHEIDHLVINWMYGADKTRDRQAVINPYNEEWFCEFGDKLSRKIWKEYERHRRPPNRNLRRSASLL